MTSSRYGRIVILKLTLFASLTASVFAQNLQLGQTQYSIGTLLLLRPDGVEDRLQGKRRSNLFEQDVLRTDQGSQGLIDLGEGVRVALNENTTLQLSWRWEKPNGITKTMRLKRGEVWVRNVAGAKPLEIETSTGTAIVQNAEVDFKVSEGGESVLSVIQGTVQFATPYGWCTVSAFASSSGGRGKGCSQPSPANVQQIAQWSRELLR